MSEKQCVLYIVYRRTLMDRLVGSDELWISMTRWKSEASIKLILLLLQRNQHNKKASLIPNHRSITNKGKKWCALTMLMHRFCVKPAYVFVREVDAPVIWWMFGSFRYTAAWCEKAKPPGKIAGCSQTGTVAQTHGCHSGVLEKAWASLTVQSIRWMDLNHRTVVEITINSYQVCYGYFLVNS